MTPRSSAGFEAARFAHEVLGIKLLPWQRWLLIHMLELNPDGTFRFRTVLVLVARQNGKTTLMQVLALWRMFVDAAGLIIGTAQNLDLAEEAWQGAVEMAEGVPELNSLIANVDRTNGKKALRLDSGERYKVLAASRRGGRGLSGDEVLLDELREHQTWDAWGAITKTTMARPNPQIAGFSNAGDAASIVLVHLRTQALAAMAGKSLAVDEDDPLASIGLFEWSGADDCCPATWDDPTARHLTPADWRAVAQANPALGWTIKRAAILSALGTDPEEVFRTEVLCQHVDDLDAWQVIPRQAWTDLEDPGSRVGVSSPVVFAAAVDEARGWGSISKAGGRGDGLTHLELVDRRPGTEWMGPALVGLSSDAWSGAVVVDDHSPAGSLITELEAAGVSVVSPSAAEWAQACAQLYDAVMNAAPTVRHLGQPEVSASLGGAAWRSLGDARALARKGLTVDSAPVESFALALWGFTEQFIGASAGAYVI